MQVLLLDNHDSFSAILYHYLWELSGEQPLFFLNDALTRAELAALKFDAAIISPGPGHPARRRDFGICQDLLELFPQVPILGVCLGHQGLALFGGGKLNLLPNARHGRPSPICHNESALYQNISQHFMAVRYHSWVVDEVSLPSHIEVTSRSDADQQIMGLSYRDHPWHGVQFHPESVSTEYGKQLLKNFLNMAGILQTGSIIPATIDSVNQINIRNLQVEKLTWANPEDVFRQFFDNSPLAFWLDGEGFGASCMGQAETEITLTDSALNTFISAHSRLGLEAHTPVPWSGFRGGLVGQFSYELLANRLSNQIVGRWLHPQGFFVFDKASNHAYAAWEGDSKPLWMQLICEQWNFPIPTQNRPACLPDFHEWLPRDSEAQYCDKIKSLQEEIAAGESYEACLTHAYSTQSSVNPFDIYCQLRLKNPSPYAAYFSFNDVKILSASPELFLELSTEGTLRSRPIKGTIQRGKDFIEDAVLHKTLLNSPKDRAENRMIVDITRHDISRLCNPGSVCTTSLFEIENHPAVFQMVSEVQGSLQVTRNMGDILRACFPGGSMTGAPKERTIEILAALEEHARGIFSGAMGYFSADNTFILAMAIRTLENQKNQWRIGCGGAILAESNPLDEWNEACLKARSIIDAVSKCTNDIQQ